MAIIPSGSFQQLFILSLPDKFPLGSARDQLFVQSRVRGPLLNHYVWNMHSLADYTASLSTYPVSNAKIVPSNDPLWKLLLVANFTNDQGISGVVATDTFNPITAFTHYDNNQFKSIVDIKYSPFISYSNSTDVSDASLILYKSMVLPSYPVMFTSSITGTEHYGPLFPTNISIDVDDGTKQVGCSMKFVGGKSIFAYPKPQINLINTANPQSDGLGFIPYRTANIFDCHLDFKTYSSKESFLSSIKIKNEQTNPENISRISGMSMTISSDYDFKSVAVNNERAIFQGPRYATLRSRTVTGFIKYTANTASFNIPVSSELTMYFGDIFYFPMQNVDWQKPNIELVANNNYVHTFRFIARAVDRAVTNSYRNPGYCSEFLVDIR
jgi:hypothetical protein